MATLRPRIWRPITNATGEIKFGRRVWRLVIAGVVLLLLVVVLRSHFVLTVVVGNSMLPSLEPGDLLLVDKRAYLNAEPRRGDVVVARDAAGLIIKRIVGLPGEEVEVRRGKLYINGIPQNEEEHEILQGPLEVGKGKLLQGDFATLGDNRAIPPLLAIHPIVSKADILGKVVFSTGKKRL